MFSVFVCCAGLCCFVVGVFMFFFIVFDAGLWLLCYFLLCECCILLFARVCAVLVDDVFFVCGRGFRCCWLLICGVMFDVLVLCYLFFLMIYVRVLCWSF